VSKHQLEKPCARELYRIAERAGCPIRVNGGHAIVTLPNGRMCVMPAPGRSKSQHLDDQIRQFKRAGLWPDTRKGQ
jgi:hypothetical protein